MAGKPILQGGGCEANETIAMAANQLTADFMGAGIADELARDCSQKIIIACLQQTELLQQGDSYVAATAAFIGVQVVAAHKSGKPYQLQDIINSNLDRTSR
jgi:hypothetical protein